MLCTEADQEQSMSAAQFVSSFGFLVDSSAFGNPSSLNLKSMFDLVVFNSFLQFLIDCIQSESC